VFSGGDGKVYILQHYLLAARNIHVAHAEKLCRRLKFSALLRRHDHDLLSLDRVKATWLIRPPLPSFEMIKCLAVSLSLPCAPA
jgi:hypothetical protein